MITFEAALGGILGGVIGGLVAALLYKYIVRGINYIIEYVKLLNEIRKG